jgi:hypothetical protein
MTRQGQVRTEAQDSITVLWKWIPYFNGLAKNLPLWSKMALPLDRCLKL